MIKFNTTDAYRVIPFSKLDIKKLYKILNKLTKVICNISKSIANILIHLSNEDFGVITTSLLSYYIYCICQQPLQALDEPWQLGIIYQGLTQCISTKSGGSFHPPPPKLKHHAFTTSPITMTLFLLEREYDIHTITMDCSFPIKCTPLEQNPQSNPTYTTLTTKNNGQIPTLPQ